MDWTAAEAAIRNHVETQWALTSFAADTKLFWENENWIEGTERFVYLDIQGINAEKTIFGGTGLRMSVESGIVFFSSFVEKGVGKAPSVSRIVAMTQILQLRTLSSDIDLEGGAPPSPVEDDELVAGKPGGSYFRCSGSVPFILRSNV